jgi:hypothetical protein
MMCVPKFKFEKWDDDYGNIFTTKKRKNAPSGDVEVKVKKIYNDIELKRILRPGSAITMPAKRALFLAALGLVELKGGK